MLVTEAGIVMLPLRPELSKAPLPIVVSRLPLSKLTDIKLQPKKARGAMPVVEAGIKTLPTPSGVIKHWLMPVAEKALAPIVVRSLSKLTEVKLEQP